MAPIIGSAVPSRHGIVPLDGLCPVTGGSRRLPVLLNGAQLSRPAGGGRADPAVVGVYVDIAAAHDGDDMPAGETVAVFEDRRDAERGRRLDDQAGVAEEHP